MKSSLLTLLCLITTAPAFGAATETAKAPLSPRVNNALHALLNQIKHSLTPVTDSRSTETVTPEKAREAHDILSTMLATMHSTPPAPAAAMPAEAKDEAKGAAPVINHDFLLQTAQGDMCCRVLNHIAFDIQCGFSSPLDPSSLKRLLIDCLKATGENEATINEIWEYGFSFYKKKHEGESGLAVARSNIKRGPHYSEQEINDSQACYEKIASDYNNRLKNELQPAWRAHTEPLLKLYESLYDKASAMTKAIVQKPENIRKLLA